MDEILIQTIALMMVNANRDSVIHVGVEESGIDKSNFQEYGNCEENVTRLVHDYMPEILARAEQLQKIAFMSDDMIAPHIQ